LQEGQNNGLDMPPKIRELINDLEKAGFVNRGGKGSHKKFVHSKVYKPVVLSGNPGDDALDYQIKFVRRAIEESKK
jgi:predicted RNA binding protein YcfA (HicA-like mRNA interferase family)